MKKNIGIVTTWFERGAAYVSKAYVEALQNSEHKVFIYARGGENIASNDEEWNKDYVTWGKNLSGTNLNKKDLYRWVKANKLDIVFFNEQHEFSIVAQLKKDFEYLKIGSYIDYYKENTIKFFNIYDFIICNTKRHYSVFKDHSQSYYIPWGTDIQLFKPNITTTNNKIVFFHSAGMSNRKGTDLLINAFIKGDLYNESKLIIHTQIDIEKISEHNEKDLENNGIKIIKETITAPGLYHLGDVYVYPTRLEGLGLTTFEALACGLPVITTDNAPMNETINNEVGKLVKVERYYSRWDGYYWPLSECNIDDLILKMRFYIKNISNIDNLKIEARKYAEENLDWKLQYKKINEVFTESRIRKFDNRLYNEIINKEKKDRINHLRKFIISNNNIDYIINIISDIIRDNR